MHAVPERRARSGEKELLIAKDAMVRDGAAKIATKIFLSALVLFAGFPVFLCVLCGEELFSAPSAAFSACSAI